MKRNTLVAFAAATTLVGGLLTLAPPALADDSPEPLAESSSTPIAWKNCGSANYPKMECGSLQVPMDHSRPGGRQITIAVSRIPHTAEKSLGPLLVNPGGPGAPGRGLAGYVAKNLSPEVAAQFDVIGFDPAARVRANRTWTASRASTTRSARTPSRTTSATSSPTSSGRPTTPRRAVRSTATS